MTRPKPRVPVGQRVVEALVLLGVVLVTVGVVVLVGVGWACVAAGVGVGGWAYFVLDVTPDREKG